MYKIEYRSLLAISYCALVRGPQAAADFDLSKPCISRMMSFRQQSMAMAVYLDQTLKFDPSNGVTPCIMCAMAFDECAAVVMLLTQARTTPGFLY